MRPFAQTGCSILRCYRHSLANSNRQCEMNTALLKPSFTVQVFFTQAPISSCRAVSVHTRFGGFVAPGIALVQAIFRILAPILR